MKWIRLRSKGKGPGAYHFGRLAFRRDGGPLPVADGVAVKLLGIELAGEKAFEEAPEPPDAEALVEKFNLEES